MDSVLSEARSALRKAKEDSRVLALEFHVGDKVYLDASDIHTTRPSQKLAHRYLGPFTVT